MMFSNMDMHKGVQGTTLGMSLQIVTDSKTK